MPFYNDPKLVPMDGVKLGAKLRFIRNVMYGKTVIKRGRKCRVVAVHNAGGQLRVRLSFHSRLFNTSGSRMTYPWGKFEHTKMFTVCFINDNCRELNTTKEE